MGVVTFKLEGTCPEIARWVFFHYRYHCKLFLQHIKLQFWRNYVWFWFLPQDASSGMRENFLFFFLFFFLQGLDHSAVGLNLVSNIIKDELGLPEVSVLMGANLAKEVAREMFGEATIGKEFVFIS